MRFGIVSMYPYRPHVQDMVYLSNQLEEAGHSCVYLSCNKNLPTCYYNLFKGKTKSKIQCAKCMIGGLSSYVKKEKIYYINKKRKKELNKDDINYIINSTIASLGRIENESEIDSIISGATRLKLVQAVEIVYQNTLDWLHENNIEGVLVFNGRLDLTRAVVLALKNSAIPFISIENHLNGVTLNYNSDCLSLEFINKVNTKYKDLYLTKDQSVFSGKIIGEMFLKKQKLWRTHNLSSKKTTWPIENIRTKKVLITPSSKYEFIGSEDWRVHWTDDYTEGYQKVIEKLGVNYSDCVLRCHPFWHENLGALGKGDSSESHYTKWANKLGIYTIASADDENTLDLIKEADIVLVNGGTAGIEAAILGKTVISVGRSRYNKAGFTINVFDEKDIKEFEFDTKKIDPSVIQRRVIRYLYNYHARFEQFYDIVWKKNALKNNYVDSSKVSDLILKYFHQGYIDSYVSEYGSESNFEDVVIEQINGKNWNALADCEVSEEGKDGYEIKRRGILSLIDLIRDILPAGHY